MTDNSIDLLGRLLHMALEQKDTLGIAKQIEIMDTLARVLNVNTLGELSPSQDGESKAND
ncbi:hypothetical protein GS501_00140 [Saccharibacter sp. 17.LH.SD]|uniref:hypothetical protein n=1 Tax=Saccharibacter sp. 17.LH.SD TaxID=2689393 RepID=UPI0013696B63|nr:hypothetical protein [Saccharibacter sp. 17.LH.SD]MXV43490.1 hypothetical protein [Saccharibacter sp. 17.LH.SD]